MRANGFVLWLIVLVACQHKPEPINLIGHWHVYYPDSSFGTWDILDTSQIIIDKHRYWGYYDAIGYWHMNTDPTNSDTIQIAYNSHSYSDFTYKYQNDTIYLSDKSYAIKTDMNQCDLPKEFFGELYLNIELPYSLKTVSRDKVEARKSSLSFIDIGNPKAYLNQFPRDTFLIQINDIFVRINDIRQYVENEQAKLPFDDRDSLILAFSVHKQAPAQMVDSIERIINRYYPNLKIIYACLPGEKQNIKRTVFTSIKNEFAKPVNQSGAILLFEVNDTGKIKWALKTPNKQNISYELLDETENIKKLKRLLQESKANNRKLSIEFTFSQSANFQDYISAQTKIKRVINANNLY